MAALGTIVSTTDLSTITANETYNDGVNIALGTTTGTKIGTGTTQKLAFFNSTPITQYSSTGDLRQLLIDFGLLATGGASPLDLNKGAFTCRAINMAQTTAPTVSAGAGLGTGPTVSIQSGSTDSAGRVNLLSGTTPSAAVLCTITFNTAFAATPRSVIVQTTTTDGVLMRPYVATSGVATGSFQISAQTAPGAAKTLDLYYWVIG